MEHVLNFRKVVAMTLEGLRKIRNDPRTDPCDMNNCEWQPPSDLPLDFEPPPSLKCANCGRWAHLMCVQVDLSVVRKKSWDCHVCATRKTKRRSILDL